MDGHHGNVSQAQATESHSQTRKVSACPVLKQGSDRDIERKPLGEFQRTKPRDPESEGVSPRRGLTKTRKPDMRLKKNRQTLGLYNKDGTRDMRFKNNKEKYGNKASAGKVTRKTQKGVSDSNVNDQEKGRQGLTPETAARTAEVDSLASEIKKKLEYGDGKCVCHLHLNRSWSRLVPAPRACLSRNRRAIMRESYYRYPTTTFCNWIPEIGHLRPFTRQLSSFSCSLQFLKLMENATDFFVETKFSKHLNLDICSGCD